MQTCSNENQCVNQRTMYNTRIMTTSAFVARDDAPCLNNFFLTIRSEHARALQIAWSRGKITREKILSKNFALKLQTDKFSRPKISNNKWALTRENSDFCDRRTQLQIYYSQFSTRSWKFAKEDEWISFRRRISVRSSSTPVSRRHAPPRYIRRTRGISRITLAFIIRARAKGRLTSIIRYRESDGREWNGNRYS